MWWTINFKGVHYEVLVETSSGTKKTVMMHVTKERDIENLEAHEKISASSFAMDLEDVETITDSETEIDNDDVKAGNYSIFVILSVVALGIFLVVFYFIKKVKENNSF